MNKCNWPGAAGALYSYEILLPGSNWATSAGNYIFAKLVAPERWMALYVGIAQNLRDRLINHERWAEAQRLGATHIHAHLNASDMLRAIEEGDLIKKLQPPLNDKLK